MRFSARSSTETSHTASIVNDTDFNPNEAARMMVDPDFRRQLRQGDRDALSQFGYLPDDADDADDVEFKVLTTPPDTFYLTLPAEPSADAELSVEELQSVQAAGGVVDGKFITMHVGLLALMGTLPPALHPDAPDSLNPYGDIFNPP